MLRMREPMRNLRAGRLAAVALLAVVAVAGCAPARADMYLANDSSGVVYLQVVDFEGPLSAWYVMSPGELGVIRSMPVDTQGGYELQVFSDQCVLEDTDEMMVGGGPFGDIDITGAGQIFYGDLDPANAKELTPVSAPASCTKP